jgi:hypothetical protein
MKKLTHSQLVALIEATQGAAIVGLQALTDTRAKRTGNPFSLIEKRIRAVAFVGADYQSAVNNEAARQGGTTNFETEELPWGKWLIKNKIIVHNGEYYLRTQSTPGNRRVQPARVLDYVADGYKTTLEAVKKFLPESKESAKQQVATGIKKTVWVRTYKFNSIEKIRVNGETFQLVK